MSIDHAAAHEKLADLALEPERLRRLDVDPGSEATALRAHLGGCEDCRAELEAWRRVYRALDTATSVQPGGGLRALQDLDAPRASPALRERTLAAVHRDAARRRAAASTGDQVRVSAPTGLAAARRLLRLEPGRLVRLGWLAAAAALVIALGTGGLAFERAREADQARSETVELAAATATLGRILVDPTHWVVTLRTADGAAGGTLAWSGSDVVVLTSALAAPTAGTTYRCWIERAGARTPVGTMAFSGGTGYWAGTTASWSGLLARGSRFGVTEVPASGMGGGSAVLVAEL